MKNNISKIIITAITGIIFITCTAITVNGLTEKNTQQSVYYTVKCENNKIVVYSSLKKQPINSFDVDITGLPNEDITLLKNGIKAETEEQVILILEDYLS